MTTERTYTVKLKGRDVAVTSRELSAFRQMLTGKSELATRMSELIWLDIYTLDTAFGVDPRDILSAITDVEKGEPPIGIKPATPFKNKPLKGLWHKHFFSAHFLVKNIVLGLGKNGLDKIVNEVMDPAKSAIITQEMVNELAHRVTYEPVEQREANSKLTGEWIIYLPHDGKNYYLCCNTHDAGDQFIYDRIMQHSVLDFPELPTWLKLAQTP